ncbi:immunity 49 family protein [Nocardia sp. 2]|uniref:Immunity 49 family protein n=1 Tax=Nocardia acididurans TaxID=2802282 RepID=A0ABS1MBQ2_9NOCA|nr:immunity 49 family protein [Nocardia acididurans]MBL1078088.1 immunity 49 family protein [Nocardia acididurans]
MRVDRHSVPEEILSTALEYVPNELGRAVKLAENGGVGGIELIADDLLDYVCARTVRIDPHMEQRETWLALRTAVELYGDYVVGSALPEGAEVRAWVEYLGSGFGVEKDSEPSLSNFEWTAAWWKALAVRSDNELMRLAGWCPEGYAEGQALVAFWEDDADADLSAVRGVPGRMLRAIDRGDVAEFDAELESMLREHRRYAENTRWIKARDLIAWEAAGLAALAHRAGMAGEIESAYLPARLVTGAGPVTPGGDGPIIRPPFDRQQAERWLTGEDERDGIGDAFRAEVLVQFRCMALKNVADHQLMAQAFRSVLDPRAEDPRSRAAYVLAAEAMAQAFAVAAVPRGTPVTVTLGGRSGEVLASGPVGDASDWEFARAGALAWITRSTTAVEILGGIDRLSETLPDTTAYARAVRAVLRGEDARPHLRAALAKTSGDGHWECLRNPRARLLERIVEGDHAGFNTVLAETLGLYRDYYSAGDQIGDCDGQVHHDALGLACLAVDRGFPLTVESDYLPRTMIDGGPLSPR